MPNPRRQDRELDALYGQLPQLNCRGFCHDSCGPVDMSVRERARIVERARKPITCGPGAGCSMLTAERRCGVYEIRPMVCRLWGLVRSMPCPYGCRPEGGLLPDHEGMRLLVEADRIGGSPEGESGLRAARAVLESTSEEELAAIATAAMRNGRATIAGRAGTLHRSGVKSPLER